MIKKFIKEMNVLRGIGISLVVLGHSFPQQGVPFGGIYLFEYIKNFIYSFHMPLFFFISGFFAIKILNLKEIGEYKNFIKDKFLMLIIPYLSVSCLAIPIKLLLNKFAERPLYLSRIIIDIILYPWNNPIIFLWFIYTLFLMFIIMIFLSKLPRYIVLVMLSILNILPLDYGTIFNINGLLKYSIYFYIGMIFNSYYTKYKKKVRKSRPIVLLIVLMVLNFINIDITILYLVKALVGIFMCLDISHIIKGFNFKLFNYIGNYSLDIYLFSWFFQTAARIVFLQILGVNYSIAALIIFICGFMPIILSILILNKFSFTRKIFLGKNY